MKRAVSLAFTSSSDVLLGVFRARRRAVMIGALALLGVVSWFAFAATPDSAASDPTGSAARDEVKTLRKENEQLKIENNLLKKENQQLRRLLVERFGGTNHAAVIASLISSNRPAATGEVLLAYSLSPSGKRHNQTCRYFQTTGGRPCGPQEGTACKICGG